MGDFHKIHFFKIWPQIQKRLCNTLSIFTKYQNNLNTDLIKLSKIFYHIRTIYMELLNYYYTS